jgi:hypothetical protein
MYSRTIGGRGNTFFKCKYNTVIEKTLELAVMAQAYNLSYSRGRDWEDHCSRPVQAKS